MSKQTDTTKKAVKTTKQARAKELKAQLTGLRLHGDMVFYDLPLGTVHKHADVQAALTAADLDPAVSRELLPRYAFARASKKMATERIIDILRDADDKLTFQFTKKFMDSSGDEWHFAKEVNLELNKVTGRITCENKDLEKHAQALLDEALEARTTSDITKIVQRMFEQHADIMPARRAGGAYFVPLAYADFSTKIEVFLAKLGGTLDRWPIPAGTQYGDAKVQEVVAEAMKQRIEAHLANVKSFTINTRKDTIERVVEGINATKIQLLAYREYMADQAKELDKAMAEADQELVAQVDKLAGIRTAAEESGEGIGAARQTLFGYAITAVLRWMGKERWDFTQASAALEAQGVQIAPATIRAQLLAGRQGKRGDPAPVTPKQAKALKNGEHVSEAA